MSHITHLWSIWGVVDPIALPTVSPLWLVLYQPPWKSWDNADTTKGHLLHELHPTVLTQGVTQDPQHLRLLHVLRGVELPVPRQHRGKRWKISENWWDSMDSVDVEYIYEGMTYELRLYLRIRQPMPACFRCAVMVKSCHLGVLPTVSTHCNCPFQMG